MKLRLKKKLEKQGKLPVTNLKKYKRKSLAVVLGLISLAIISVMGASFAVLSLVITGEEEIDVTLGAFDITLNEGEVINLSNAQPVSDGYGLSTKPYTFTISNTGTVDALYRLTLESDESVDPTTLIHKDDIKIAFKEGTSEWSSPIKLSNLNNGLFLASNKQLSAGSSIDWEIKLWMDIDAGNDAQGKIFKGKLKVEAVQQSEGYFVDTISPVITMNGESVVNIKTGDTYTDEGIISIYDDTDTVTTDQVTKIIKECSIDGTCVDTDSVDTTSPTMYQIYYQYTDTSGNIGLAVRSVNVHLKDTVGPVITLNEGNLCYDAGAGYVDAGVTALDDIDGDITKNVVVINSVSENILGVYTVKYIVSDTTGNYSIATRTVEISEGPNAPELVGDMIPVVYDGTNWVKADASAGWYNYCGQQWANAVTVTETNRATLVSSVAGTVIPMDDINAMFVWIPRYSYTIGNTYGYQGYGGDTPSVNTPGAFDIKWIDSNTTELGTAAYTGDEVTNWYTNPAFCWGDSCDDPITRANTENRELSGIWVGKFETSTTGEVESNSVQQPIIKPSVISWRSVNVSNMFNSVKTYMNSDNGNSIFGLSGSTYDTHMMKNTEWGAVAYLSQSKYGKYGNTSYTGANKEVILNSCSSYITGIAGNYPQAPSNNIVCTTNAYETEIGQTASTTGNMHGIYDMSGGSLEYVMGYMKTAIGNFYSGNSGFTTSPASRYYNSYEYGTSGGDFTRGMLGDATKESENFYEDYGNFVNNAYFSGEYTRYYWFFRGGSNGIREEAGVFGVSSYTGINYSNISFRISLIP